MIVKSSKLSDFKIKKLVWHFCVDIEASKVCLIVGLNRNTVNRFYHLFRTIIYYHRNKEFKRVITGDVECDEAYFGGKRLRGASGKRGRGTPLINIKELITLNLFPMVTALILTELRISGHSQKEDLQSLGVLR